MFGPVAASSALVGRATVVASVCSEAMRQRLRRQVLKSFELEFDLSRRKATRLVRPTLSRKDARDSHSGEVGQADAALDS